MTTPRDWDFDLTRARDREPHYIEIERYREQIGIKFKLGHSTDDYCGFYTTDYAIFMDRDGHTNPRGCIVVMGSIDQRKSIDRYLSKIIWLGYGVNNVDDCTDWRLRQSDKHPAKFSRNLYALHEARYIVGSKAESPYTPIMVHENRAGYCTMLYSETCKQFDSRYDFNMM
jgi:hypothetical protein